MTMALRNAISPRNKFQLQRGISLTKGQERLLRIFIFAIIVYINDKLLGINAYAEAFTSVSEVLGTGAFTGNTEWLEKLNFVAKLTQGAISIFGIMGIMLNAIQIVITLMALTAPKFWDKVDKVHQSDGDIMRRIATGVGNAGSSKGASVFNAAKTKGLDLFFEALYSCLPNLKALSDVGDGEYKGALDYIIKTGGRHIITFLVYTMMLTGTLFDSYIVIVDGFGAVANRIGSVDSAAWVNGLLDSKTLYSFSLGKNGNELEKFKGSIARKMYSQFVKEANNTSETDRYEIASAIEQYASKMNAEDFMSKIPGATDGITGNDWKYVSVSIVLNQIAETGSAYKISASELGIKEDGSGKPYYYHLFFNYNPKNKDGTFYFTPTD